MIDDEVRADYRDVFGEDPEPWRGPLGALRLTLAGDAPWTLERARHECEELVRVLNEVDDESVPLQAAYDDLKAEYAAFREDMRFPAARGVKS